ncbi:MAG: hypothetical protein JGK30_09485 [Microcoleus sp. PH2017_40_RAT_O_B]|uniref:hypothetical protein n=1 Tax=unclassified Microcoleus TaxID=2642155 RepID=UPI001DFB0E6E|nr:MULTISPECIES: hypothetical protein [unclassified Microcoleus]MCC3572052.1 hypothetical protein [Microcoleus sp. PH2017_34_RAT_O_A]MCC3609727.1 hypothetical protein [Microcoleus sp. PH2017_40_RAT_O_B]
MTKLNCLELDFSWKDIESSHYLRALSLPTLPWAAPFLPLVGLPNALLEQPSIWESIYTQAFIEHETHNRMRDWTGSPDGERGELVRQVIVKALSLLAQQMGRDVAIDLEKWVRFHFFCPEAERAMREWGITLRIAYFSPNSRKYHRKIPPPAVLVPILPLIEELVDFDRRTEIYQHLKRVAPPPPYEQIPYEYMEHCYEMTMISGVLDQALTLKALQTIASRLNDMERKEVAMWAQAQALIMYRDGKPENLCGDKYLQVELPCFDVPSLLDFYTVDESA